MGTPRSDPEIRFGRMELADRENVLALLRSAHPGDPRQGDPEFWNWHFLDHPNSEPGKLPVWVAKAGESVVGQLATIPVRLRIAGETVPAIWILDLLVDPAFRRRGIMKKLVVEAQREYPFMLGTATRRQHSAALLTGLGWRVFSPIPRYHKLLFPGNALREIAAIPPLRGAANAVFAPFRRVGEKGDHEISMSAAMDEGFAKLYEASYGQWGCSVERGESYLRWQFRDQPNKRYEFLALHKRGELRGYAILYFRKAHNGIIDKAALSDICYHPDDAAETIDALISTSVRLAVERRTGALVTDALDPLLAERLRGNGFWRVESGQEIMATAPRHQEVMFDPARWHLTRADSDISIFEDPNI